MIKTGGGKKILKIPEKYLNEKYISKESISLALNQNIMYVNKVLHLLTREQLEFCYKKNYENEANRKY